MKKYFKLLGIITFLIIFNNAYSQDTHIGVRGGLNLATFVGEDVNNADFKPGIHVGPYVRFGVADQMSFQPELLISAKGYRNKFIINNTSHTFKATLYYLDIPLLLNFEPALGHMFSIGLQPSILLADRFKDKSPDVTVVYQDIDIYNTLDLGFVLGYAYEFGSGLNIASRFTYGLPYVIEDELEEDDNEVHNLVLQLSLGYTFGL